MPPFTTQLRTPPQALMLAPADAPTALSFRVQLLEAWDALAVVATADTPVAVVKARALSIFAPDVREPDDLVVKLGGFEVRDERVTLSSAGVKDGATLLLHFRRRQPLK